jgi:hypothetical protein
MTTRPMTITVATMSSSLAGALLVVYRYLIPRGALSGR